MSIFRQPRWHAYAAVFLLACMLVASNLLLLKLTINNAPQVYLPADAPSVILDRALRQEFPNDQILVALFEGTDIYSDRVLLALDRLAERLEQWPLMERVLGVTRADHISATADGFSVERLLDLKELQTLTLEQRRERVLADRFAPGALASADGQGLSLIVRPVPLGESLKRMELEEFFRAAVTEVGLAGHLTALAGMVPLDAAELRSMLRDNLIFVPLTSLVGLVLLWWMVRHLRAALFGLLAVSATVSATLAGYVLSGQPYNLVSSMTPPLISALTIALLLHLYNSMALAARLGVRGSEQVHWAVREIRKPALFTALTTAAGLASLSLSPIPPIRSLGLTGAAGAILIYFVVIGLLPPILAHWPGKAWPTDRGGLRWMRWLTGFLSAWGIRRPVWTLAAFALLLGAGIPFIWQVKTETNLLKFFAQDHPITQSTARIDQQLSGVTPLQIVFDGPSRDSLKEPDKLAVIQAVQDWVLTLPEVDQAFSLVDFIEEMHWAFHGQEPRFRSLPEDAALISQYLFVYDGRDLYDFVNHEFQRTVMLLNLNVHGAREIGQVIARIRAHLQDLAEPDLHWEIGGEGRLFSDQETLLIQGQIRSLWGALMIIFILLVLAWRSPGAGLLCMLPNIAPILFIFMVMGAVGINLNMATALIASVAVGIAVDDTIHFYDGYQRRRHQGLSVIWSLARTYRQTGQACVATTIILSAQFAVLMFSDFQPIAQFGLLTSVGLLAALLFDLLLLPAILIVLHASNLRQAKRRSQGEKPLL
ncbi:efflux RND transporter permease subunit [Thiocystis violascens]|uniref:Putative RND superfamily exporter n=1 Tax=Thiocystis violascens (strain ATCC 17096 / DSM 198 / 6111) TaxID=765911 RepID=I3YGG2_THIV6|nr:MMPL family transporter [Thiocystis violascens]AFL76080.1 putative RND superfamily exporter [Thiocystis violascens DSM 198]